MDSPQGVYMCLLAFVMTCNQITTFATGDPDHSGQLVQVMIQYNQTFFTLFLQKLSSLPVTCAGPHLNPSDHQSCTRIASTVYMYASIAAIYFRAVTADNY